MKKFFFGPLGRVLLLLLLLLLAVSVGPTEARVSLPLTGLEGSDFNSCRLDCFFDGLAMEETCNDTCSFEACPDDPSERFTFCSTVKDAGTTACVFKCGAQHGGLDPAAPNRAISKDGLQRTDTKDCLMDCAATATLDGTTCIGTTDLTCPSTADQHVLANLCENPNNVFRSTPTHLSNKEVYCAFVGLQDGMTCMDQCMVDHASADVGTAQDPVTLVTEAMLDETDVRICLLACPEFTTNTSVSNCTDYLMASVGWNKDDPRYHDVWQYCMAHGSAVQNICNASCVLDYSGP